MNWATVIFSALLWFGLVVLAIWVLGCSGIDGNDHYPHYNEVGHIHRHQHTPTSKIHMHSHTHYIIDANAGGIEKHLMEPDPYWKYGEDHTWLGENLHWKEK